MSTKKNPADERGAVDAPRVSISRRRRKSTIRIAMCRKRGRSGVRWRGKTHCLRCDEMPLFGEGTRQ